MKIREIENTFLLITHSLVKKNITRRHPHINHCFFFTGIISVGILLGSLLLGLLSANAQSLNRIARPIWFKFFHNFIGITGYVIGMVSLYYGFYTGWFRRQFSEEARDALSYVTFIVLIWSLYAALISLWNQMKIIVLR